MNMEMPINPEKEPVSYEKVLDAFKALRESGIKDLEETADPDTGLYSDTKVQEAFDLLNELESQKKGSDSIENAKNFVKAARLLIDAGYVDVQTVKNVVARLNDEYAYELKQKGGVEDEATNIIREAIDTLIESPKNKFESSVKEVIDKVKSGDRAQVVDAVRQIADILSKGNIHFKKYFKTAEGKKKFEYIKKLEPIVDQIYRDTRAGKEVDLSILDSIVE